MKYSEAEKRIKALSSKYEIDRDNGDFDVVYNGKKHVIHVSGNYEYGLYIYAIYISTFSNMPFSNKLYMILADLASTPLNKRTEQKKRYVKICNHLSGYLNIDTDTIKWDVDTKKEIRSIKTKFTDKEIEQLKQRDDIPLDWNKVKFEEVEDETR